jgi:hypothetical protein
MAFGLILILRPPRISQENTPRHARQFPAAIPRVDSVLADRAQKKRTKSGGVNSLSPSQMALEVHCLMKHPHNVHHSPIVHAAKNDVPLCSLLPIPGSDIIAGPAEFRIPDKITSSAKTPANPAVPLHSTG